MKSQPSVCFKFKQFGLTQERTAMKVGTDGVLLGAWARVDQCHRIWDVGCGTGLLALMAAQRSMARIMAIEIDEGAAMDARDNIASSPWADRITLVTGDANDIVTQPGLEPDLIICNPPFFANSLKAPDATRSTARHESTLGCTSIVALASRVLSESGRLAMITPADRHDDVMFEASLRRLLPLRITEVCSREGKAPTRLLWEFGRNASHVLRDRISIRNAENVYTGEYKLLTSDFYLNF